MFRLALQARDTACTIDLYERAEIVDEKLYLAHDANIAEQINSGTFTSPLDHYVYFGDLHDRASFSLLRELTGALKAQLNVAVPLTSLRTYIEALAQGAQLPSDLSPKHITDILETKRDRRRNGANGKAAPRQVSVG